MKRSAYSPIFARERLLLSVRNLQYFFCWVILWQGSFLANSPIQIFTWISLPKGLNPPEIMVTVMFLLVLIERTLTGDYTLRRSYFNAPLLYLAAIVFISWARGEVMNQRFAIVLEIHDLPEWPLVFLMLNNAFRDPEEGPVLFKLLFLTILPKTFESFWTFFFSTDPTTKWGILQSWRDGYFLDIIIVAGLVFMHYRGTKLKPLKWFVYISILLSEAILILGFRRAAILSSIASAFVMFVTLPRDRRRRQLIVVSSVIGGFILFTLLSNPLAIVARFLGVLNPAEEGSAYIRLMELPNVLLNIWHHPLLGIPFGIPWKTYYRMPISAYYTTLGTHTSYLYWPLRMGIFGVIAFAWIFGSMGKSILLNYRFRKTEEDFLYGQLSIQMMVCYFVSSFFGLMYADGLVMVLSVMMVAFQHQSKVILGTSDLREISFLAIHANRKPGLSGAAWRSGVPAGFQELEAHGRSYLF
ncbi:MAG: O-antigen ligase family protein, partial [Candidatus Kapaibacterium sp.]